MTFNLNKNLIFLCTNYTESNFITGIVFSYTTNSIDNFFFLFGNGSWIVTRFLSLKNHFNMINSSSILLKLSIAFSITLPEKLAHEKFFLILLTLNWKSETISLALWSFSVTECTLHYQYIGYFDFFQNTCFFTSLFPLVISVSKNFVGFHSTVNFMLR